MIKYLQYLDLTLDQIAGLNVPLPAQGATRQYRATVDKELSPGKYKIEITHRIGSQSDTKTTVMEIFPARLTEESENKLINQMNSFAYYGYPLTFNVEPSSGGKIKANQFRIYMIPNSNSQVAPKEGLAISQGEFRFTNDMKNVTVKVTWNQEATGKEIDIFPAKQFTVKQEEPSISTNRISIDYSGSSTKIKVRVSGIKISNPTAGVDEKAIVSVVIGGEPQKKNGLETYSLSTEPSIDGSDGEYTIEFELTGKLDRGQTKVSGIVDIPVTAVATNPVNKVKSEPKRQNITVNVNYEPDRGGPRRGTGGLK